MTFFIRLIKVLCLILAAFGFIAAALALFLLIPAWLFFTLAAFFSIVSVFVLICLAISEEEKYDY